VSVVTGAGKTLFAEACLADVVADGRVACVVIIVPTLALVDQWYVSLVEDLGVSSHDLATYSGEGSPGTPRNINLMVLNTARRAAPAISGSRRTLLVVDECHRAASPENAKALSGEHVATLGLSATPERDYDDLFEAAVAPALGPVIYRYDYNRAREDGVIAPFVLINVRFRLGGAEQDRYDEYTRKLTIALRRREKGDDTDDRIVRLLRERSGVSNRARVRIPLAVRLVERHPSQKVIVFHEEIRSANEIVQLLRERGRRAAAYHSHLGPDLRRDNLRQFRRGQVDALVTCRALDEGVNVPDAAVAVIASGTASTRQRVQRLGRVLRPSAGKENAVIYTLFATDVEERRLREEEDALEGADRIEWLGAGVADG
jgi:superfamily II DNA or RNA helicase